MQFHVAKWHYHYFIYFINLLSVFIKNACNRISIEIKKKDSLYPPSDQARAYKTISLL